MIRILGARWPLAKVLICPVRVQGREAPAEIAAAIGRINQWQCADCLITGRGGGSLEDLWAFNEECVARAVYASRIPVISAVGHEPDVTISDFVADVRASTPSNAAEIAAPDQVKIREIVDSLALRLSQAMGEQILRRRQQLDAFQKSKALTDASFFVDIRRMEIDRLSDQMSSGFQASFSGKREELISCKAALNAMSPMRVLSRGYSIAEDNCQNVLRSIKQISVGERLTLHLCDGKLGCVVENREVLEHGT
jgi:exodeoxyribonuclease VII large subunit